MPNQRLAANISGNSIGSIIPLPAVESLLLIPYNQKVVHTSNVATKAQRYRPQIPVMALEETKLCLALARPIGFGIHAICHGTVAPDNLPFMNSYSGWSVYAFKQPPLAPPVLEIEMRAADDLLAKFGKLNATFKAKLMVPMKRLNDYSSGSMPVDKAIDLRICLESIFLGDGNKEQLRYRLSLRAALLLGSTLDEKRQIMKLVKDSYDITSTAVHSGNLPQKKLELLPKAATIAKQAIVKMIDDGEMDWEVIELAS